MCKATEMQNNLETILNDIQEAHKRLEEEVSKMDKELSNLYHEAERRPTINACEGYYLGKRLHDIAKRRRVVKHEYDKIKVLSWDIQKSKLSGLSNKHKKHIGHVNDGAAKYTSNWRKPYQEYEQEVYESILQ